MIDSDRENQSPAWVLAALCGQQLVTVTFDLQNIVFVIAKCPRLCVRFYDADSHHNSLTGTLRADPEKVLPLSGEAIKPMTTTRL
ncbi:MAG TPA: hypothetical protein DDZ51_03895 [Planctomycetaceae bacterium]|nr:hypothetical protein [Planctomycetaceae bacterium]